ncbi:helix-turn-helix domain-containing protein [Nocardioides sp. IC4_145]|nr:helix-turn-helix domain-containing protein [Nocardioides sp. IC4_145]
MHERDLLGLLARGQTVDAAARQLGISSRTARRRLRALADGLGVDTTIEVVVRAVRDGHI